MKTQALDTNEYLSFFKQELTENLLSFWMTRCLDRVNGGYLNCFTNDGSKLISTDKYTWSQGRFLWIFSKLSMMESEMFSPDQRQEFLRYAENGKNFLLKHVLLGPEDYRCVFLMDAQGQPKRVADHDGYDLSISADCFVVMGFAAYSLAAKDEAAWDFAKRLGDSVWERYQSGNFRSLPYPVTAAYQSHAKPMLLTNVCCELFKAAKYFAPQYAKLLQERIEQCHREVFEVFQDENHLVHEFKYAQGDFPNHLFGQHINPGHTLEDMWFQLEAAGIIQQDWAVGQIGQIVQRTMELGWDEEWGGLYHFVPCDGLNTAFQVGEAAEEPQMKLVLDDWGSKLWWVHSEAMYTTLLLYCRTNDDAYWTLFQKVFQYTYRTFPNPDRSVREWIQIRTREGLPQEKVVALPVKDPYHIIRNVILLIELLEGRAKENNENRVV